MNYRSSSSPGLFAHGASSLAATLRYAKARLALAGIEAREAGAHYGLAAAMIAGALFIAVLGYVFLVITLVFALAAAFDSAHAWLWVMAAAGPIIHADYSSPYLSHATMEPMTGTAWFKDDGTLEVWTSTQNGEASMAAASEASGLPLDKVEVHQAMLGGGFIPAGASGHYAEDQRTGQELHREAWQPRAERPVAGRAGEPRLSCCGAG